jgi:hypothetical protein
LASAWPAPGTEAAKLQEITMRLPRGPGFVSLGGVKPPPGVKDRPALAVGSRAVVAARNGGRGAVTLTDDTGSRDIATIADGTEVEVVAWRPRRGGDTRYRVMPTGGGPEGWLGASDLKPRQVVTPPKRVEVQAPPSPAPRSEATRPRPVAARKPIARPAAKRSRRG